MKARYRLIFRGIRGGMFYCFDTKANKRQSLGTRNENEAKQLIPGGTQLVSKRPEQYAPDI